MGIHEWSYDNEVVSDLRYKVPWRDVNQGLRLRKLADGHDPGDRVAAMSHLLAHEARGEILTGLLYVSGGADNLHAHLHTTTVPLNCLDESQLCPGAATLAALNAEFA